MFTPAFSQARKRLPLALVQWAIHKVRRVLTSSLPVPQQTWKGHRVRLLDGTTFGVLGTDDLDRAYGRAQNQHGIASWITVRSVAAFWLFSRMLIGYTEGSERTSEQAMVRSVLEQDDPGAIYIGDTNLVVPQGKWCSSRNSDAGYVFCASKKLRSFQATTQNQGLPKFFSPDGFCPYRR